MPLTLVWMNTLSKLVVVCPCLNLISKKLVSRMVEEISGESTKISRQLKTEA